MFLLQNGHSQSKLTWGLWSDSLGEGSALPFTASISSPVKRRPRQGLPPKDVMTTPSTWPAMSREFWEPTTVCVCHLMASSFPLEKEAAGVKSSAL